MEWDEKEARLAMDMLEPVIAGTQCWIATLNPHADSLDFTFLTKVYFTPNVAFGIAATNEDIVCKKKPPFV